MTRATLPLGPVFDAASRLLRPALLATLLVTIEVAGSIWLSFAAQPAVEIDSSLGQPVIVAVRPGSVAALAGVRPGMVVVAESSYVDSLGEAWNAVTVALPGGQAVTVPVSRASPIGLERMSGIALVLALAVALSASAPALGWALNIAIAQSVKRPLMAGVDGPLDFLIWALPVFLALLFALGTLRRAELRALAVAAFAVPAVLGAYLYMTDERAWTDSLALSVGFTNALVLLGFAGWLHAAWPRIRGSLRSLGGPRPTQVMTSLLAATPAGEMARASASQDERHRLADRIHSDVLPTVLNAMRRLEEAGRPEADCLREAADELRDLVGERRCVVLEMGGLVPGLAWLAETLEQRYGKPIEVAVSAEWDGDPPAPVAMAAYRVAHEAIINAFRHGPASKVAVGLTGGAAGFSLTVDDDGRGVVAEEVERAAREGHVGVPDMRAQAALVGARLTLDRRAEGGTRLSFAWR